MAQLTLNYCFIFLRNWWKSSRCQVVVSEIQTQQILQVGNLLRDLREFVAAHRQHVDSSQVLQLVGGHDRDAVLACMQLLC